MKSTGLIGPIVNPFYILYFSGQLQHYRFGRILRTLDDSFPAFQPALAEYVFEKARAETEQLKRQPQPSNITFADLEVFDYGDYYAELTEDAPVLHAAITGSMARHFDFGQITVGFRR